MISFSAVNNFFTQLASRAGKMEKLLARIEKYQPENKNGKNEAEPLAKKIVVLSSATDPNLCFMR